LIPLSFRRPSRARKGGICSSNLAGGCPISGRLCRKWGLFIPLSFRRPSRARKGGICSSNPAGGCPISGRLRRKWGLFIPLSFRLPSRARKGGICSSIQRAGAPFPADFAGGGDSSFPCHSDARAERGKEESAPRTQRAGAHSNVAHFATLEWDFDLYCFSFSFFDFSSTPRASFSLCA
jgi:hypothetical protein